VKKSKRQAQTFVENTLLLGIVTMLVVAMSPMARRGAQAMVRLVADQFGNQEMADQAGGDQGYLVNQEAKSRETQSTKRRDRLGTTSYDYYERTKQDAMVYSNQGLSEE
jgi:hypothetical protein